MKTNQRGSGSAEVSQGVRTYVAGELVFHHTRPNSLEVANKRPALEGLAQSCRWRVERLTDEGTVVEAEAEGLEPVVDIMLTLAREFQRKCEMEEGILGEKSTEEARVTADGRFVPGETRGVLSLFWEWRKIGPGLVLEGQFALDCGSATCVFVAEPT